MKFRRYLLDFLFILVAVPSTNGDKDSHNFRSIPQY
jgi:hypothetical protein